MNPDQLAERRRFVNGRIDALLMLASYRAQLHPQNHRAAVAHARLLEIARVQFLREIAAA